MNPVSITNSKMLRKCIFFSIPAIIVALCCNCTCSSDRTRQYQTGKHTPVWIEIPAGTFTLGSPVDEPCRALVTENQVEVTISRPFVIAQTEITRAQWVSAGFSDPSVATTSMDAPVNMVSWFDALAYCNRLSEIEGLETCYDLFFCSGEVGAGCPNPDNQPWNYNDCYSSYSCIHQVRMYKTMSDCRGYRLPTSAEWEYAARAGTTTATYAGQLSTDNTSGCVSDPAVDSIGWHCGVSDELPEVVAQKEPNNFGLYDMLGNVREWTDYVYIGESLETGEGMTGPLTDPMGETDESADARRSLRGGHFSDEPCYCKSSRLHAKKAGYVVATSGFRPVRTIFSNTE